MSKHVHLTSGPITGQLIRLCLPLLAANVLQQLYNIINSLVVTYYIGGDAFAALGVAESVMNLFIYVITGACMGSSVLVARFFGEENFPRLRQQLFVSGVLIGGTVLAAVTLTLLLSRSPAGPDPDAPGADGLCHRLPADHPGGDGLYLRL